MADQADEVQAKLIASRLEAAGLVVWSSPIESADQRLNEAVLSALQAASAVVLVFSAAAASSRLVDRTLLVARQHHKPVIHVRLEEVDEGFLRQELLDAHWIEWNEPDAATAAIIGQAYLVHQRQGQQQGVSAASQPNDRKGQALLYVLSGGALAAIVLALIIWITGQRPVVLTNQTTAETSVNGASDMDLAPKAVSKAARPAPQQATSRPQPVQQTLSTQPPPLEPARSQPQATRTFPTSFNCSRASTVTEVTVCGDPVLASLDARMGRMYYQRRRQYPGLEGQFLLDGQRSWLARHNRCGADYTCLSRSYQERIDDLSYIGE